MLPPIWVKLTIIVIVVSKERMGDQLSSEIMTLQEIAAYLRVGQGKVYRLAQEGRIPASKVGRTWRFRKDLVDAWLAQTTLSEKHGSPVDPALAAENEMAVGG